VALENVTLLSTTLGLIRLPNLMWMGSPPSWPISADKQLEVATMMDKSRRFAFFSVKREWGITLGFLTKTQLDELITYNELNEILIFTNNNEDATTYNIVIVSFSYEPERMDVRQLNRYKVEMTLREM